MAMAWEEFEREVVAKLSDSDILAYLEQKLVSCTFRRMRQSYALRHGTDDLRWAVAQEMYEDQGGGD